MARPPEGVLPRVLLGRSQVFGKRGIFKKSIYSIAIEPNGDAGEIILGGVHKGIKGWVPLVTAKEYPLLSYSPQWVIRIRRALAVAYDGTILANLPVTRARFDTGNTWMSMPSAVFQKHGHLGELPSVSGLQLMLDNDVVRAALPVPRVRGMQRGGGGGGSNPDAQPAPPRPPSGPPKVLGPAFLQLESLGRRCRRPSIQPPISSRLSAAKVRPGG